MRSRLSLVVIGSARHKVDTLADLYGEHWVLHDPITYTHPSGEVVVHRAIHDHNVLEKHLEAPANAGASVVGGA